ncbi:MAG: tetratricopeptide repeat protein [Bacteroidales bacterium]|nr:tetratricopeptide repeat protein [Bacteroidales bacterium]
MSEVINSTELFIEQNKKKIIIVVVAVLVVVLAIFGLRKMSQNRNEKANAEMYAAEQYFTQGDYKQALEGNTNHAGLAEVAKKYGSTKAGNRAKYLAAYCNLELGNYADAVKYAKSAKLKDQITKINVVILNGDAEMELGNTSKAISLYEKAAKMDDNFITTPAALRKAAEAYLLEGNKAKAKELAEKVKDYPESAEYNTIDKLIGLCEAE